MAIIFLEHYIVPFEIPSYLHTDNGPRLVCKFSASICSFFDAQQLETTAYHPQTNRPAKWYSHTITARLQNYIAQHQRSWD